MKVVASVRTAAMCVGHEEFVKYEDILRPRLDRLRGSGGWR